MSNFALFCIAFTLASISLVTCAKINTEMTTQVPQAMDNSKMLADTKILEGETMVNNSNTGNSDIMDLMDAMKMCNESFRTEMAFLISLNESGSFPDETDKTPKCFLRCVLQSLEIATMDNGTINPERAAVFFADERGGEDIVGIATFCAQRDEENHCEMAYNFLKCLFSIEIERNGQKSKL